MYISHRRTGGLNCRSGSRECCGWVGGSSQFGGGPAQRTLVELEAEWSLGTTYPAHIYIKTLEPLPELLVFIRIVDQGAGSVADDIHALPISKALKECSERCRGVLKIAVPCEK